MENPYSSPSSDLRGRETYTGRSEISERIAATMRATRPWVLIVSITGFIGVGVNILGMFAGGEPASTIGGGIFGIIIGLILAAKLYAYSGRINDLLKSGSVLDLEAALREHRTYWKIFGIMILVFFTLGVVFAMLGVASASRFR